MVTRVAAASDLLKWARERSKLTLERASSLLKCKKDFLDKIEKGEALPHATLFRRMAEVYLVPEATLLGLAPPVERALPRDFRTFEGAEAKLSYETVAAIRLVEARQDALEYLASVDDQIVAPALPIHSLKEDPAKLGANFRKQLGFPVLDQLRLTTEQAFTRWRLLIEDLGVSVYVEPLGDDDTRGVSFYFNDFPAILVDQNEKQYGARSFTLMHEFAHLLVRQAGISNFNPRNAVERFCNQFAANFLLPKEAIEAALPGEALEREPTIAELDAAARKLCVTISQLALRLEELDLAKDGYFKRIVAALGKPKPRKRSKGGPEYKYVYLSRYGHYLPDAVLGSLDRGTISRTEAARMLEVSTNHFAPIRQVMKDRRAEALIGQAQ